MLPFLNSYHIFVCFEWLLWLEKSLTPASQRIRLLRFISSTQTNKCHFFLLSLSLHQRQQKQRQLLGRLQDLLLGPKADEQTTCEVLDYFLRRLSSSQVASRVLAMKVHYKRQDTHKYECFIDLLRRCIHLLWLFCCCSGSVSGAD